VAAAAEAEEAAEKVAATAKRVAAAAAPALLDLSRIESRAFKLELEALEPRRTLAHLVGLLAKKAAERSIGLEVTIAPGTPSCRADRRALEQVVTNLVDNAIKYSPERSHVRVGARGEDGQVAIFVADTGSGVAAEHLPRLFERFYRVDAGRSRELGGTGLGLAIVKHLVEAMGGTVGVKSQLGRGSTFSIRLPAVEDQ
jgi:two-component system phosphate regulon sensor histidine kinase PhoR